MITKPKVVMRLLWESRDLTYDKEDRKRFKKIYGIMNRVPTKSFDKLFLKSNDYEYYEGFCYGRELELVLTEEEYEIVQVVIENIKTGYYKE